MRINTYPESFNYPLVGLMVRSGHLIQASHQIIDGCRHTSSFRSFDSPAVVTRLPFGPSTASTAFRAP